jgi:hypothetical protein
MESRKIVTEYNYPSIPVRDYDWRAYREGWDLDELIGYGKTKEQAIQDLLDQEQELNF